MSEDWRDIVTQVANKLSPKDDEVVRKWEADRERMRLESALRCADIPKRVLRDLQSQSFDCTKHPIPKIQKHIAKGQRMVLLLGAAGTGKTVGATWVIHHLPGAYFIRMTHYIALSHNHKTAWDAERASLRSALVVDEIGEEQDWERGSVDQLLAARYDMLPDCTTLCTSNLTPSDFGERYGERILSRFRDPRYCAVIACQNAIRPQRRGKQ